MSEKVLFERIINIHIIVLSFYGRLWTESFRTATVEANDNLYPGLFQIGSCFVSGCINSERSWENDKKSRELSRSAPDPSVSR